MNRKLGEVGKINPKTIVLILVIAVAGYFAYQYYLANYGDVKVKFELTMADGSIVPLSPSTTLYLVPDGGGPTNPLLGKITYNGQTVKGVNATLYLKATTDQTGTISISYTGAGTITLPGYTYGETLAKFNATASIQPNVDTQIINSTIGLGAQTLLDKAAVSRTYVWRVAYSGTGKVGNLENSFSCVGSITFTYTATSATTGNFTLTPSVKTGTFEIL